MKPLGICLISPIYHPHQGGGLESYVRELVRLLQGAGHRVSVITLGEKTERIPDSGHGEIFRIRRPGFRHFAGLERSLKEWAAFHFGEIFSSKVARECSRAIELAQPDLVFSQSSYGLGRKIFHYLSRVGKPWLHYVHSYDLVCKRQTAVHRNGENCAVQCSSCRQICRFKNGSDPLRGASVVFNSEYMRDLFSAWGLPARRHRVIHPVLEIEAAPVSSNYQVASPVRLIYVGRVALEKGVHFLCEAFSRASGRFELEILGDGPLLADLQTRYAGAGIRFHGRVDPARRDELMRQAHALVVPSLWNEPFGRVVQEGFLAGLPVIASRMGGVRDLIAHEVDGFLFDWETGHEAEALTRALRASIPLLETLRAGALLSRAKLLEADHRGQILGLLEEHSAGHAEAH